MLPGSIALYLSVNADFLFIRACWMNSVSDSGFAAASATAVCGSSCATTFTAFGVFGVFTFASLMTRFLVFAGSLTTTVTSGTSGSGITSGSAGGSGTSGSATAGNERGLVFYQAGVAVIDSYKLFNTKS